MFERMYHFCTTVFVLCHLVIVLVASVHGSAFAQISDPENRLGLDPDYRPQTTSSQICFTVKSTIEHTTYGQVISNYYQQEDGTWSRHTHNFRIKEGEDYPVCTTGPFFEDRKMLIKVKSLIPLLSCYFDLQNGGETLTFFYKYTDDDVRRLWANCDVIYPNIDN